MTEKIQIKVDEDYDGIVEPYLDNIRNDIVAIRNHLNESDFQSIINITHQMRGSGRSFGFDFITKIGELLEQAANQKESDTIKNGLNDLEVYLDKVEIQFVPEDEL